MCHNILFIYSLIYWMQNALWMSTNEFSSKNAANLLKCAILKLNRNHRAITSFTFSNKRLEMRSCYNACFIKFIVHTTVKKSKIERNHKVIAWICKIEWFCFRIIFFLLSIFFAIFFLKSNWTNLWKGKIW